VNERRNKRPGPPTTVSARFITLTPPICARFSIESETPYPGFSRNYPTPHSAHPQLSARARTSQPVLGPAQGYTYRNAKYSDGQAHQIFPKYKFLRAWRVWEPDKPKVKRVLHRFWPTIWRRYLRLHFLKFPLSREVLAR
jgi:hypothetical protein